jgi:hypothetical protein
MRHGSHKAEKTNAEVPDDEEKRASRNEPIAPIADTHEPLDRIPANEGGEGDGA